MGCSGCGKVVGSVVDLGARPMGEGGVIWHPDPTAAIRALEVRVAQLETAVFAPCLTARKLRKVRASKRTAK